MLAHRQGAGSVRPPRQKKRARPFWLDVYDHFHVFGSNPVSFEEWARRMRPGRSFKTADRAWQRYRDTLTAEGVPHETTRQLIDYNERRHATAHGWRLHVRLLPGARAIAMEHLPPVDGDPELVVLEGGS